MSRIITTKDNNPPEMWDLECCMVIKKFRRSSKRIFVTAFCLLYAISSSAFAAPDTAGVPQAVPLPSAKNSGLGSASDPSILPPKTVVTAGIDKNLGDVLPAKIIVSCLPLFTGKIDFIVIDPEFEKRTIEDGGNTLRLPANEIDPGIKERIYAKIDDYGSIERLRQATGEKELNTKYVLTVLYPREW